MLQRSLLRQSRQIASSTAPIHSLTKSSIPSQLLRASSPSLRLSQQRYLSSKFPAPTRAKVLSRWFSQETPRLAEQEARKEVDESLGEGAKLDTESSQQAEQDPLKKELEAKNKEIIDLKDKYLRQVAEFRNLQERTKREVQSAKDFAIQRFARDLIESVDNFDLALSTVPKEKLATPNETPSSAPSSDTTSDPDVYKDLRELYNGLRMTENVLINTLKKHGLERFDPSESGEKFDPNLHEATFQTPQPDKQDGTVFYTTQKGFILNGRVLRAAKVGVVKNS